MDYVNIEITLINVSIYMNNIHTCIMSYTNLQAALNISVFLHSVIPVNLVYIISYDGSSLLVYFQLCSSFVYGGHYDYYFSCPMFFVILS
jgi:hypothetical protein